MGNPIDPTICTLPEDVIHDLIRERMECKFARNFHDADRIQLELEGNGVDVHDGFKEWRADGETWGRSNRFSERPSRESRGPKVYYQRGPGKGLSPEEIDTISTLVAERSEAKSVANYNRADEIFDQLGNEYNVNVDDKRCEWALLNEEYLLNKEESSFVPDEEIQSKIGKLLGDRILARKSRDFDKADDIRDELREVYVVEVDDRSKEWVVTAPEGAMWADDDDDKEDTNVVSKQEWDEDENEDNDKDGVYEQDDDDVDVSQMEMNGNNNNNIGDVSLLDESTLSALTVPELKEKLRGKGLPVSGRKSELIERLINA